MKVLRAVVASNNNGGRGSGGRRPCASSVAGEDDINTHLGEQSTVDAKAVIGYCDEEDGEQRD